MLNIERRQLRLEQLLQRLKQERLKREQRQPRLERVKCLLEKQHRFNSKMPSIEPHRVRLEQQKPRRDLPLNKLAILTLISEPELLKLLLEIPSLNLLSKLKVHLPRSRVNTLTHD